MSTQTAKDASGATVYTQGSGTGADASNGWAAQHGSIPLFASVEVTRPANATAYTANDMVGLTVNWEWVVSREASGSAWLFAATVATDQTTATARLEIDFYSAAITDIADNAEATRLYANQASYLGTVTFPPLAKKTAASTHAEAQVSQQLLLKADASSKVYGIVRTLDAFTPASGQKVRINLYGTKD
jgi:hypothetical protein